MKTLEQQQRELDDLVDLCASKGWKVFVQQIQDMHTRSTLSASSQCDTNDKWQFRRGELNALSFVILFEESLKAHRQNIESQTYTESGDS